MDAERTLSDLPIACSNEQWFLLLRQDVVLTSVQCYMDVKKTLFAYCIFWWTIISSIRTRRCFDVIWTLWTSNGRRNNVKNDHINFISPAWSVTSKVHHFKTFAKCMKKCLLSSSLVLHKSFLSKMNFVLGMVQLNRITTKKCKVINEMLRSVTILLIFISGSLYKTSWMPDILYCLHCQTHWTLNFSNITERVLGKFPFNKRMLYTLFFWNFTLLHQHVYPNL